MTLRGCKVTEKVKNVLNTKMISLCSAYTKNTAIHGQISCIAWWPLVSLCLFRSHCPHFSLFWVPYVNGIDELPCFQALRWVRPMEISAGQGEGGEWDKDIYFIACFPAWWLWADLLPQLKAPVIVKEPSLHNAHSISLPLLTTTLPHVPSWPSGRTALCWE